MILRPLARLLPAKRATRRRSTPPRRRAARRALLWGLAALFVVHLALAAAVETVLPHVRDPEYGYRERNAVALQRAHPDRPLVLVLGTSRTQNGIDPAAMDFSDAPGAPLAFNAGLSGSWPVHLRLTYHRLRDAGVRPAAVLIEVFPPTLSLPAEGADFLFADRAPYLTAADLRRLGPYLTDPATLRRKWAANRVNSLHALRTVVVSNLAPKWQPWQQIDYHREALDRVGFTPYPYDTVSDEYRARKRAGTEKIYAPVVRTLADTAFAARAFRDLVADCRGAGIPVAFFLTPESPAFRS